MAHLSLQRVKSVWVYVRPVPFYFFKVPLIGGPVTYYDN